MSESTTPIVRTPRRPRRQHDGDSRAPTTATTTAFNSTAPIQNANFIQRETIEEKNASTIPTLPVNVTSTASTASVVQPSASEQTPTADPPIPARRARRQRKLAAETASELDPSSATANIPFPQVVQSPVPTELAPSDESAPAQDNPPIYENDELANSLHAIRKARKFPSASSLSSDQAANKSPIPSYTSLATELANLSSTSLERSSLRENSASSLSNDDQNLTPAQARRARRARMRKSLMQEHEEHKAEEAFEPSAAEKESAKDIPSAAVKSSEALASETPSLPAKEQNVDLLSATTESLIHEATEAPSATIHALETEGTSNPIVESVPAVDAVTVATTTADTTLTHLGQPGITEVPIKETSVKDVAQKIEPEPETFVSSTIATEPAAFEAPLVEPPLETISQVAFVEEASTEQISDSTPIVITEQSSIIEPQLDSSLVSEMVEQAASNTNGDDSATGQINVESEQTVNSTEETSFDSNAVENVQEIAPEEAVSAQSVNTEVTDAAVEVKTASNLTEVDTQVLEHLIPPVLIANTRDKAETSSVNIISETMASPSDESNDVISKLDSSASYRESSNVQVDDTAISGATALLTPLVYMGPTEHVMPEWTSVEGKLPLGIQVDPSKPKTDEFDQSLSAMSSLDVEGHVEKINSAILSRQVSYLQQESLMLENKVFHFQVEKLQNLRKNLESSLAETCRNLALLQEQHRVIQSKLSETESALHQEQVQNSQKVRLDPVIIQQKDTAIEAWTSFAKKTHETLASWQDAYAGVAPNDNFIVKELEKQGIIVPSVDDLAVDPVQRTILADMPGDTQQQWLDICQRKWILNSYLKDVTHFDCDSMKESDSLRPLVDKLQVLQSQNQKLVDILAAPESIV